MMGECSLDGELFLYYTTTELSDVYLRYIPEGTQVYVPPYSMHRYPAHFSPRTDEFVPERWLKTSNTGSTDTNHSEAEDRATVPTTIASAGAQEDDGFVHKSNALIPFSYGQANCVGRNLARREMMMVVCAIMQRFEVTFDEGYHPCRWERELGDHFVSKRGELETRLVERS